MFVTRCVIQCVRQLHLVKNIAEILYKMKEQKIINQDILALPESRNQTSELLFCIHLNLLPETIEVAIEWSQTKCNEMYL